MPLPIITDTIRTSVEGILPNGHPWANVIHYRKTAALTFTGAINILDPLVVNLYTVAIGGGISWRQSAPASATLTQIRYTPLDGTTATDVRAHAVAGNHVGDSLPSSVCIVATLRTAQRGRSRRGRVYWSPFGEDISTANGTMLASAATSLAAQWAGHLAALAGSGVSLVVASYLLALATDVVSVTVDTRFDTQRRRLNT